MRRGLVGAAFALAGLGVMGAAVPPDSLNELAHLAIQHNGRLKPLDSFAREVLDRLSGSARLDGQDPLKTLLSILTHPGDWQKRPILSVPFIPLREPLGLGVKTTHISYSDLIAGRKLMPMLPGIVQKQQLDEKLTMLENEVMELYDRFVSFTMLTRQELALVPPPHGEGPSWVLILNPQGYPDEQAAGLRSLWEKVLGALQEGDGETIRRSVSELSQQLKDANPAAYPPPWRLRLEVLYNRSGLFQWARLLYALGAAALLVFFLRAGALRNGRRLGLLVLGGAFLLHGAGISLRVILGGRPPVSNFYETMLWLPFVGVVLSLIFERIYRNGLFGFAGGLVAALFLILADHLPLDPSISPVVAVLRSNLWLTIHVLTIVGSYAPIALAMVLAHLYGILSLSRGPGHPTLQPLGLFLYRSIQVGVVMLAAGIMLGAVWANASWGRYWGWDPKETWALITLLWFLAVLHGRFAGWLSPLAVAICAVFGFLLVLMTYYGVSFYLVGLHSYAGGNAKPFPPLLGVYLGAEAAFMAALGWAAMARRAGSS